MNGLLKILLGGVYGYVCYAALLWLIATAAPKLGIGGDALEQAILWPTHVYLYVLPRTWAETPTAEILMTLLGTLIIFRGMYAAAKKLRTA